MLEVCPLIQPSLFFLIGILITFSLDVSNAQREDSRVSQCGEYVFTGRLKKDGHNWIAKAFIGTFSETTLNIESPIMRLEKFDALNDYFIALTVLVTEPIREKKGRATAIRGEIVRPSVDSNVPNQGFRLIRPIPCPAALAAQ